MGDIFTKGFGVAKITLKNLKKMTVSGLGLKRKRKP
jgi:hypothetical protein